MGEPLISVIIPVYKTEAFLGQCVSSIVNQSYSNWEVLLVDDESPDGCPLLCDRLADSNQKIHVIHKKNEGAALARATGLAHAAGEYCMFVDGDDWIDPDTLECCVHTAQKANSDCVIFGYVREYPGNAILNPLYSSGFNFDTEQSEEQVHRRLIGPAGKELSAPHKMDNLSSMCMKLYRISCARKGRIVSDRIVGTSEDTIFNLYALDGCRISYVNRCMYHYRKDNAQSITTHYKPDLAEKWNSLYGFFQEYIEISGRRSAYELPFLNRVACGMIGLGLNEARNPAGLKEKIRNLRAVLDNSLYCRAFQQLNTGCCPLHWKLFFFLCRHKLVFPLSLLLQLINYLRPRAAA